MKLKCLVGIKRCLDNAIRPRVDKAKATVDLTGCKMSLNPYCEIAVEEAIRQKAAGVFSTITGLTIGGPDATDTIRTALAMGLDQAIHVVTPKRTDLEISPIIVSRVFAHLVTQHKYDVVLLGKIAIDDSSEQTAQLLSGTLNAPLATNASKIVFEKDGSIKVWKDVEEGVEQVQLLTKPVIISCESRLNVPRFVNIMGLKRAKSKKIETMKLEELKIKTDPGYQITSVREQEKKRASTKIDLDKLAKLVTQPQAI